MLHGASLPCGGDITSRADTTLTQQLADGAFNLRRAHCGDAGREVFHCPQVAPLANKPDADFVQLPVLYGRPIEMMHHIIDGEPGYGEENGKEWPKYWYGVKGFFRWLEKKSYKMHVRVFLARYRSYTECAACGGARLRPGAGGRPSGPKPRSAPRSGLTDARANECSKAGEAPGSSQFLFDS